MGIRDRWNPRRVGNLAALIAVATGIALVVLAEEPARGLPEAAFLDANRSAMTTMMLGMAIEPTGDVDRDFVHMMVPHHQGAIDMATAVLRYGHDPVVRRLAQEIVVTQHEEIAAMRRAVGEPLPPSLSAPTSPSRGDERERRP